MKEYNIDYGKCYSVIVENLQILPIGLLHIKKLETTPELKGKDKNYHLSKHYQTTHHCSRQLLFKPYL